MTMQEFLSLVSAPGDRMYLYSQDTCRLFELSVVDAEKGPELVISKVRPIAEPERHGWEQLTAREREVISLVLRGKNYRAIAELLFVSVGTVKKTAHNAYQKLGIGSRWDLLHEISRA